MQLRDYQQATYNDIHTEWNRGRHNVLAVQPTGSGKTALFTKIQQDFTDGYTMAAAHRQELVAQISHALAKWGVPHRIFAPNKVIRLCVARHTRDPEIRRSFHNTRAPHAVAAVDTLLRRAHRPEIVDYLKRTRLQIADEAHHVLYDPINKWGRGYDLTASNLWGPTHCLKNPPLFLGVTATAIRADGNGLGRHSNGVFDVIVHGVKMRWLIESGYLKKYRIFNATPRHTSLQQKDISARTGDYKRAALERDARENHIVGDVVQTYVQHAKGKRGITFAPSVEIAQEMAYNYCQAGVPAMCVSDKTSDEARESAVWRLQSGELLQLVNVDLFGEGFDLPSIECASFARRTMSYGLYVQQFGRALRPTPGVDTAMIFDHVGNVIRHGLPDGNVNYTLDATERHRKVNGAVLARTCDNCGHIYERIMKACPYCGWVPPLQERSAPEFVDGDLTELDEETLRRMRGEAETAVQPVEQYHEYLQRTCPTAGIRRNLRLHEERIKMQNQLRSAIVVWAGYQRDEGLGDSEIYRRFYHSFGVDVLSAQALNGANSASLAWKVLKDIR